jgi:putative endonuclease
VNDPRAELGAKGEQLAERFLRKRGLNTLARRFRTPAGEIDLVMREGETIVFVEVKTQSGRAFTDPETRVTLAKQRKLLKAAKWFLTQKRWTDKPCRFDVIAVIIPPTADPQIDHFPDAFVPQRW